VGHLRRWTLKRFLVIFADKAWFCELILALVSLWLLVNSIKKEKSQRERPIDFFCFILQKDIFLLLYYYFTFFLVSNVVKAQPNGRISL